jgi:hypothetical protein
VPIQRTIPRDAKVDYTLLASEASTGTGKDVFSCKRPAAKSDQGHFIAGRSLAAERLQAKLFRWGRIATCVLIFITDGTLPASS